MFSLKQKHIHKNVFYSFDALGGYIGEHEEKSKVTEKIIDPKDIPGRKAELLKEFNATLTGRLSSLGIPFNTEAFGKKMEGLINTVLDSKNIPDIAKQKFLDDLKSKMELFTKISKNDIQALRDYRTSSLQLIGQSGLEESQFMKKDRNGKLVKMDEMDIQIHYLRMILDANLAKYVEGSALGLKSAFEDAAKKEEGGVYRKEGLDRLEKAVGDIDKKYGLDMVSVLKRLREKSDKENTPIDALGLMAEVRKELVDAIAVKDKDFDNKRSRLVPTNSVTLLGKTYKLRDIINEYAGVDSTWRKQEAEVRNAREKALAPENFLTTPKKMFGFDKLESEFSSLSQDNMESTLRKGSKADFAIAIVQAIQILPALGDAVGVNMDIRSALFGIDADGRKLNGSEHAIAGAMGLLGLLFVGGAINKVKKGPKAVALISAMRKVFAEKWGEWSKEAGGIGKDFSDKVQQFMKWFGEGVATNAEHFMNDKGLQPAFASIDESKRALAWKRSAPEGTAGIGLSGGANMKQFIKSGTVSEGSNLGLVPDEWIDGRLKALGYTDSSGDDNVRSTQREVMTLLLEKARREKAYIVVNEGVPISLPIQQRSLQSLSNELEYLRMGKKEDARSTPVEGRLVAEMARRNLFLSKSKIYTVLPDTDKVDYEQTLLKAEEALKKAKLLPEDGISPEDADLIYKGHIAGKPIGQQDFGSIRDKVKASEGLNPEWRRVLMDKGVMGRDNPYPEKYKAHEWMRWNELKSGDHVTVLRSDGKQSTEVTFIGWSDREHTLFEFIDTDGKRKFKETNTIVFVMPYEKPLHHNRILLAENALPEQIGKLQPKSWCIIQYSDGLPEQVVQFIGWNDRNKGTFTYRINGHEYHNGDMVRGRIVSGPINIATKQVNVGNLIREKELELNSLINTRNQIMAEIAGRNKRNMHELDKLDPNISTLEREIQGLEELKRNGISQYDEVINEGTAISRFHQLNQPRQYQQTPIQNSVITDTATSRRYQPRPIDYAAASLAAASITGAGFLALRDDDKAKK